MRIQDFKTLIQLQSMESLNASSNSSITSGSGFTELLSEVIQQDTANSSLQTLGSVSGSIAALLDQQAGFTNYTTPVVAQAIESASPATAKATDIDSIISKASSQYNVPEKLIKSVIRQESNFNPEAKSYAGASGLMQLMPATAKSLGVENVFDPEDNVMGGVKYLSQMLKKYDGDIKTALAAYNAGPGNVDKYNGVPPFKETQNYVEKIMNHFLA
ncbi:lytic transglycosylase domain-containing protein [Bacillus massiliglaciei]|uniref:lytic transglycosylase domain-containing protein n=1 Tax=Bacillus massiliglaciei TaxID=1816693 RepID=UPI000B11C10A|nr:lytic transglycosylase domain-containing protein [Bacillus massiliglaciei]